MKENGTTYYLRWKTVSGCIQSVNALWNIVNMGIPQLRAYSKVRVSSRPIFFD